MSRKFLMSAVLVSVATSFGCWEQVSYEWFPQMKRQIAVQAYEEVLHRDQLEGFTPPEGTVPVGGSAFPDVAALPIPEQESLENPFPATLESLKRGEMLFARYCATCHGPGGAGNGPVAGPPFGTGPLGLVLPIGGPTSIAKGLTDGHIYTTISMGRGRMPNYRRIRPEDRWNIVNFVRELNGQGGRS